MERTLVISLGAGSLSQGFSHVTARLWAQTQPQANQFVGTLPAAPALANTYRTWQSTYRALADRLTLRQRNYSGQILRARQGSLRQVNPQDGSLGNHGSEAGLEESGLEIEPAGITQISQQSFEDYSQQLKAQLNDWLASSGWWKVERALRSQLSPTDEIRVIIETSDDLVRRLPWYSWHFFQDYPQAEMALSRPEYQQPPQQRQPQRNQAPLKILAILGDTSGIDSMPEQRALESLPDVAVEFLVTPSRQQFDRCLWHKAGWDILFFAGHSQTESQQDQQTGRLYLNENPEHNSLTIEQLEEALKQAISNGLQLAIFNSCDGIGLAEALTKLQIPQVIVMREPVPNRVAQVFLQHFLAAFVEDKLPLYTAVRQARRKLQGLESEFPGASWLPVLCQNPATQPFKWHGLESVPRCPYKGLSQFEVSDAPFFFGRERVVTDLLAAIERSPFTAIVGPSGSGKSSVVFAGLVPLLNQQLNQQWQVATCRPSPDPFEALAEAVLLGFREAHQDSNPVNSNPIERYEASEHQLQVMDLGLQFRQRSEGFYHWLQEQSFALGQDSGVQRLLIIDQFEELYTNCAPDERQPFVDLLLEAALLAPNFALLITLRADFYGHALSDRRLSDALQTGSYNLSSMTQSELRAVIGNPAAQANVSIEERLVETLIADTVTVGANAQNERLPLLAFTLSKLWEQQDDRTLTYPSYQTIGGVDAALANHAESVYAQLSPEEQRRSQRIFLQLIVPGHGTESTRRVAYREEVGESNWSLVSHLASARLVTTSRHTTTGKETVEVIHEALIRAWARLEHWIKTDADFRHWQERLRYAMQQWEATEQETAALLRGTQLSTAQDWLSQREEDISSVEKSFIQKSLLAHAEAIQHKRRRQQFTVASLSAGLLIALGLGGIAGWGWQRAILGEVKATVTVSDALFSSGQRLDALVAALSAQTMLEDSLPFSRWASPEIENETMRSLRAALAKADEKNRLTAHTAATTAVAFANNQQFLASASKDKTVRIWNLEGVLKQTLRGHSSEIWGLAISPDSQLIASASDDRTVKLWRPDGTEVATLSGHDNEVNTVAFSPDGTLLASADESGIVRVWRANGQPVQQFLATDGQKIDTIAFSPAAPSSAPLIATGSGDGIVRLWTLDGQKTYELKGHTKTVRAIAFSPDGKTLASASADHTVSLWDIATLKKGASSNVPAAQLEGHESIVYGVAFSQNGDFLASASDDNTINLWRQDGTLVRTLAGHNDGAIGVAFGPSIGSDISSDNLTLASTSYDETVRLWQTKSPLLTRIAAHTDDARAVIFGPNDQMIASSSTDRSIKLWQLDGTFLKHFNNSDSVYSLAFSPDGHVLVSGDRTGEIAFWPVGNRLPQGHPTTAREKHSGWITGLAYRADGQRIASASDDRTVKLWQPNGTLVATLRGHTGGVRSVAFSPTNQHITSASEDTTVRLWDPDGQPLATLDGHLAVVNKVAYSPDGRLIASASDDKTIRLWQSNGDVVGVLSEHTGAVTDVAFSPDGGQIASSSVDKTIRLWSAQGELIATFSGYSDGLHGLTLSKSGEYLAASGVNGEVNIWNLQKALVQDEITELGCNWIRDYLTNDVERIKALPKICA